MCRRRRRGRRHPAAASPAPGGRPAGRAGGSPFLVEKPIAERIDAAREIEAIARSIGASCGVSENYAFLAPVIAARELLAMGEIGTLLTVQATRVFELGEAWRRDGWRLQAGEASGAQGVIVDQATHVARLVRTVVGEPVALHAFAAGLREGWAGRGGGSRFRRGRLPV